MKATYFEVTQPAWDQTEGFCLERRLEASWGATQGWEEGTENNFNHHILHDSLVLMLSAVALELLPLFQFGENSVTKHVELLRSDTVTSGH